MFDELTLPSCFGQFKIVAIVLSLFFGLSKSYPQASGLQSNEASEVYVNEAFQQAPEPTEPISSLDGITRGIIDFVRPADAVQLVGESESLLIPETIAKCEWTFEDGVLTASPHWDSVATPEAYRDFRLHVEFNLNDPGEVPRERSGNSGVYLQERYELQILNSHGISVEDYRKDDCACIYGVKKPDKIVCLPPGQWQTFDIAFRAARFDGARKIENARITVYHNGELIHDDVALPGKTGAGKPEENSLRPIKLQGHHNPVQFRNIWVQRLNLDTAPASASIHEITVSYKTLPMPGEVFKLNGADAFVMMPKEPRNATGEMPWVWYAPTLRPFPAHEENWMFERFLAAGIAVAGIDVGESYGSPNGREKFDEFYRYLVTSRKFASKPALLARSRGGLLHYSWAAENPTLVSCIAGIYPVCNLASYPGIERACEAFALSAEQLQANLSLYNPIDRLEPIAAAKVPIFHIHGDQDEVVPLAENSLLVANRYRELMGEFELEIVEGQGHNMWDGWFQSDRLVEFILQNINGSIR